MLSVSCDIYTAPVKKMLERIYIKSNDLGSRAEISINDKFSHHYVGFLVGFDIEQDVVILMSKEDSITYIQLSNVVSVSINDVESSMNIVSKVETKSIKNDTVQDTYESTSERVDVIEKAINKNMGLDINLVFDNLDDACDDAYDDVYSLFDSTFKNLLQISSDEFGRELVSKIESIEINKIKKGKLTILRDGNKLIYKCCFSDTISPDYHSTIKRKLESLL